MFAVRCRHPVTRAVQVLQQVVAAYVACCGPDSTQQDADRLAAAGRSLRDTCDALRRTLTVTEAGPLAEAMTGSLLGFDAAPMMLGSALHDGMADPNSISTINVQSCLPAYVALIRQIFVSGWLTSSSAPQSLHVLAAWRLVSRPALPR